MKRRSLKFIACAAIMAMTLSVTACGGSDNEAPAAETEEAADTAAEAETETEAEAEPEAEAETEGDTAAAGDTLESMYADPATKAELEAAFAAIAPDGMSVGLETKGNEMTVIIKIEDSSMIVDGMVEELEAKLDQQASQCEAMAGQLDEAIGVTGECTVIMRYLDPDDNVLAEKSFKAQ